MYKLVGVATIAIGTQAAERYQHQEVSKDDWLDKELIRGYGSSMPRGYDHRYLEPITVDKPESHR